MTQNEEDIIEITSITSILAGIVGKGACFPLDTIRSKIQVQQNQFALKGGQIYGTAKMTIASEGIKGLYKGFLISMLVTGPGYSLYLTSYEFYKFQLNKRNVNIYILYEQNWENMNSFISGMLAEATSCLLWLPQDVIKERLQVQSNLKLYNYNGTIDAIRQILQQEGFFALYRAYGATIASFGPFSAFYFMFYEKLKTFLKNPKQPTFLESMVASGGAAGLAGFICNPFDVVKLRMQVQRAGKNTSSYGYRNLPHGLYLMVKNEGLLSLTKGSLAKILFTCPSTAISMSFAEFARIYFIKRYNY
ncbi:hypothetical protein pb186bvf_011993 [Paramecium bursaria]